MWERHQDGNDVLRTNLNQLLKGQEAKKEFHSIHSGKMQENPRACQSNKLPKERMQKTKETEWRTLILKMFMTLNQSLNLKMLKANMVISQKLYRCFL